MQKVFIGLQNIASQLPDFKSGFQQNGIDSLTAVYGSMHPGQYMEVDVDLSKLWNPWPFYRGVRPLRLQKFLQENYNIQLNRLFNRALKECDTFIFLGKNFYPNFKDFKKIKEAGKRLIVIFMGSDIRWYYCMKQEFESYGMKPAEYNPAYYSEISQLEYHLKYLRYAEKYADVIISLPNQSQMALRPYYAYFSIINIDIYQPATQQREIPKIVHAPSSRAFKGSKYIIEVIQALQNEGYKFEFELVENLDFKSALKKYADADIIISQILCPSGGRLAHEGLALGKVVLSKMGILENYDEKVPEDCPIVDISIDNLYQKLSELIIDKTRRQKIADQGPIYVRKYNDAKVYTKRIIDIIKGDNIPPDFHPSFFKNEFIPESEEAKVVYNRWNEFVSECDWYKNNIGSFTRNGLKF